MGALAAITAIPEDRLGAFLHESNGGEVGLSSSEPQLSDMESTRLSVLASQISQGFSISDDERLRGILEGLTIEFGLSADNIASLISVDVADIEGCLADPRGVPDERKFPLALRVSYLNLAIANARPY